MDGRVAVLVLRVCARAVLQHGVHNVCVAALCRRDVMRSHESSGGRDARERGRAALSKHPDERNERRRTIEGWGMDGTCRKPGALEAGFRGLKPPSFPKDDGFGFGFLPPFRRRSAAMRSDSSCMRNCCRSRIACDAPRSAAPQGKTEI